MADPKTFRCEFCLRFLFIEEEMCKKDEWIQCGECGSYTKNPWWRE